MFGIHKRTDKYTAEEERGPLYFGGGTGLSQILGKEDLLCKTST